MLEMPEKEISKRAAVGLTLISSLLLGSSYVAIKSGLGDLDPFLFSAFVFTIGALVALIFTLARGTFTWRIFGMWEAWAAPLITVVLLALQYQGLSMTNASTGALIIGANVILVAPLSALLFRERLGKVRLLGLAIGLGGLVVLTTKLNLEGMIGGQLIGDLMLLGTTTCIALTYVLSKYALKRMTFDQFVLTLHLFTPLPLFALYLLFGHSSPISGGDALILVYVGVLCTSVPTLLWVGALRSISIVTSSTIILSESAFAVLLSILILNEPMDVFIVLGAALVFTAIYLVTVGERKRE